jgi:hypothetical protein
VADFVEAEEGGEEENEGEEDEVEGAEAVGVGGHWCSNVKRIGERFN